MTHPTPIPADAIDDLPTSKLRALIRETELTLTALKAELESREDEKRHEEIDHLDEHLEAAELSLQSIKDFFAHLVAEYRTKK